MKNVVSMLHTNTAYEDHLWFDHDLHWPQATEDEENVRKHVTQALYCQHNKQKKTFKFICTIK